MSEIPRYAVPRAIEDLVSSGYFEELTQPGDKVRSFGIIHPAGWQVLLWVDRERFERRQRTGFRFGVATFSPEGWMRAETSGDMLDSILKAYDDALKTVSRRYRKRWMPERPEVLPRKWD